MRATSITTVILVSTLCLGATAQAADFWKRGTPLQKLSTKIERCERRLDRLTSAYHLQYAQHRSGQFNPHPGDAVPSFWKPATPLRKLAVAIDRAEKQQDALLQRYWLEYATHRAGQAR